MLGKLVKVQAAPHSNYIVIHLGGIEDGKLIFINEGVFSDEINLRKRE